MRHTAIRAAAATLLAATALASVSTAGATVSPNPRAMVSPNSRVHGHRPEAIGRWSRGDRPGAVGRWSRVPGTAEF